MLDNSRSIFFLRRPILINNLTLLLGLALILSIACGGGSGGGTEPPEPVEDTTPDSFSFSSQQTTLASSWIESNTITVTGINAPADISISGAGGEYRIGDGAYSTDPGNINSGQTVRLRLMSSATAGQSVTTTLTIGGISASFTVSTVSLLARQSNSSCIAPAQAGGQGESNIQLENAFPNLPPIYSVVGLYQAPNDDSRWYVMTRGGFVYWFDNSPTASTLHEFADMSENLYTAGEGGLLGMAFSPDYTVSDGGRVYFSYLGQYLQSTISRIEDTGTYPLPRANEEVLLQLSQPDDNHNGGNIAFGPDGYLYIAFGDGGGAGDQYGNGQNLQTLHASILRLDVSGNEYSIPADNPFVGNANALDEIFAYGLRNPWRFSFDPQGGQLWIGDVGQGQYEEVDIVTAGNNLGWPIMEGNHCYQNADCDTTGLTLPVTEYNHDNGDCSITGGHVYRGQSIASLQGHFIYGDFCTGRIWSTYKSGENYISQELLLAGTNIATFGQGNDGEVYPVSFGGSGNSAVIYRLVDQGGGGSNIPTNLSDTGCFESTASKSYDQGVVPFNVNAKLWSDGVNKTRHFAIPDETTISVQNDGDFSFPVGSVLIKNFIYDNQYLETRLFMHHENGWGGYSYKWNDAQSDAQLVEGSDSVVIGDFEHLIPSRGQCFECHTSAAGTSLGPEASQLDGQMTYPNSRTGNQLDALVEAGYLTDMPTGEQLAELVDINTTEASISLRARSYLHANCSGCHRPGGPGGFMDLQIRTALEDTQTCDQVPANGDLGITDARIIAPGDPARSVLLARMQLLDNNRMPPLGTQIVDSDAVNIISQWISSLSSCQ
ncbi:PQQ-dependent sugar dehydrogenase [Aliikangiella sp. G2MR2-5]|uniref:PQQ-dependent sugar dehydrogenase n=1 Tax=Aliikangiella sp. G2MR2-5 TaxID=2788943 RepID=UPI0018AA1AAC|nr:PQQ-dependent sugar dehydrogenase [Aliikangiella sp. G2MR2-5]